MFRAYDAERERLVAVKLFKLDLPPEQVHQLVAAFEQLIAAELSHPAMAVPLATGITGVSAYLAQDYVAAESLDLAVREYGPAPPADALRVAAQLAGALDFAAVVNTSHGALHPRDVLLSADETRMTGVGVARSLESIGVAAPVRRPYTAPERIAGAPWDRRADVFSLASLVHELLWGRRIAGTGVHVAEALTDVPGGELAALQSVFARALADDPSARFETALEFAEALKDAFPTVALTEPAPPPRRRGTAAHKEEEPPSLPPPAVVRPLHNAETFKSDEAEPDADLNVRPASENDFDLQALDLKAAEQERYQELESAPAIPPAEVRMPVEPPISAHVRRDEAHVQEPAPISMIEQSRSAVWPLVASLAVGLAIGFAGGYGVGTRERSGAQATTAAPAPASPPIAAASPAPQQPAGRESTEVALNEPPKPESAKPEPPKPAPAKVEPLNATGRPPRSARPVERASSAASGTAGRFVGRLSVESKPAGARVFLDGRLIGSTPVAVPSVPAGNHAIRIERDGYRRWSSSVRIVASEQNRVTASLER